eukprot:3155854-Alexandrium_andersonii.AAC.1
MHRRTACLRLAGPDASRAVALRYSSCRAAPNGQQLRDKTTLSACSALQALEALCKRLKRCKRLK